MKSWPKINTFLWLVAHNNILTWDNLRKRGFIGPSWCQLCEQEEETQNHLLNLCPYSSCIWDQSASIMRTSDRNRIGLKETIEGWRSSTFHSPILNRIWQLLPGFILWKIWKERNRRIFNSVTRNWQEVWTTIHTNINETISLHPWTEQDLKAHKMKITSSEPGTKYHPTPERPMAAAGRKTSPTHWEAPPTNFFKLNFDGASKGNPGPAGYGAVIQNSKGEILHILAGKHGAQYQQCCRNMEPPLWSTSSLRAISFPLIAEGDSQIVINLLSHLLNGADPEKIISKLETHEWALQNKINSPASTGNPPIPCKKNGQSSC
jgi:hypothetical protein